MKVGRGGGGLERQGRGIWIEINVRTKTSSRDGQSTKIDHLQYL